MTFTITPTPATADSGSSTQVTTTPRQPYRPSQWTDPPLTSISLTTTTTVSTSQTDNLDGKQTPNNSAASKRTKTQTDVYVFDAVIRLEHQQQIQKTQEPVMSGANVSDHAFIQPARVELEVGMSDAMDSFTPGQ